MQISLRKANALQTAINDAIKSIALSTEVLINEFQNPTEVISDAVTEFSANITRRTNLNAALYDIRGAVGKQNVTSGIADRLTSIAYTEKTIQLYSTLVNSPVRTDEAEITGKLQKIRKNEGTQSRFSMNSDVVVTGILEADQIAGFKKAIATAKKEKQKLQDQVLELNIQTKIELSDATIATLTAENLL